MYTNFPFTQLIYNTPSIFCVSIAFDRTKAKAKLFSFLSATFLNSSVTPFVILDFRGELVIGKGLGANVGMIPVFKVDGGAIADIVDMAVLGIKIVMIRCRAIKLCAAQNERTIAHDPKELDLC